MAGVIKRSGVMPKLIAIAMFTNVACSCGTMNPVRSGNTNMAKLYDSLVTDSDGKKYPVKLLSDGKLWIMANLDLNIPDSYCYENVKHNCEQYGRLYTWESATEGCRLLEMDGGFPRVMRGGS